MKEGTVTTLKETTSWLPLPHISELRAEHIARSLQLPVSTVEVWIARGLFAHPYCVRRGYWRLYQLEGPVKVLQTACDAFNVSAAERPEFMEVLLASIQRLRRELREETSRALAIAVYAFQRKALHWDGAYTLAMIRALDFQRAHCSEDTNRWVILLSCLGLYPYPVEFDDTVLSLRASAVRHLPDFVGVTLVPEDANAA